MGGIIDPGIRVLNTTIYKSSDGESPFQIERSTLFLDCVEICKSQVLSRTLHRL